MRKIITNALVYRTDVQEFQPMDILVEDGIITDICESGALDRSGCCEIDANGMAVLPGLVDVHTHGCAGYDFVSQDIDLDAMARCYAKSGVTTVMPTLASAPYGEMMAAVEKISEYLPSKEAASFCGVHLEGRYLNPDKKGAHALSLLAPLSSGELDAPQLKKLEALHISAAYELDTDGSFAKKAKEIGATLGLGHTCATYEQAKRAEELGITAYTHLFNAMPTLHHREGGAACACLVGDAYGELICDGIHIVPEMVALAYRCKGSKISLISDSMEATGSADGEYSIAGNPVIVKNGKALTLEGALAGSTLTLDNAVRNLMRFCGIPLTDAIICATKTPAQEVGVFDICGSIDIGKRADMLFVSDIENFNIEKIMIRGNFIEAN